MKVQLLSFSQTGNTFKVGEAIAAGLSGNGVKVKHMSYLKRKFFRPEQADLIGIGCPVFENLPAPIIIDYLKSSGFDLQGKQAFVYITCGGSPARSLWKLGQAVSKLGAEMLGGIQVRGTTTFPTLFGLYPDRPTKEELGNATEFGAELARAVIKGKTISPDFLLDPQRGRGFYDLIGPLMAFGMNTMIPKPRINKRQCNDCMVCVKECPSESMSFSPGEGISVGDDCVRCYRCWHICGEHAVKMKFTLSKGLPERLIYSEFMEKVLGDTEKHESVGVNLFKQVLSRRIRLKYDQKKLVNNCEWEESP